MRSVVVDVGEYDAFFHTYYIVYILVSVLANLLLIYLLKYHSPSRMKVFKMLLINTAIGQICLALLNFFVQERMIPSGKVLALLPIGPCRMFGNGVCFVAYNLINVFNIVVGLSILITMHFRYRLLRSSHTENMRLGKSAVVSFVLPLFLLVTPHVGMFDEDDVMNVTQQKHPHYNLESYGRFGGFKSTDHPFFLINSAILATTAVSVPLLTFYWRWAILKMLDDKANVFKQRTKTSSKALVKVLTLQAALPAAFYLPIALLYPCSQFLEVEMLPIQYLTTALPALSCAVDPLISIYFIAPYRRWLGHAIRCWRPSANSFSLTRLCAPQSPAASGTLKELL